MAREPCHWRCTGWSGVSAGKTQAADAKPVVVHPYATQSHDTCHVTLRASGATRVSDVRMTTHTKKGGEEEERLLGSSFVSPGLPWRLFGCRRSDAPCVERVRNARVHFCMRDESGTLTCVSEPCKQGLTYTET